ncbi:hypothetical protein, partial [Frankia sp. Cr1]|uniref:hypothetical protein n=1 Tax=Frankia sp. Cr1 TaxID=3073931 RepID=UPI002AD4840E
MERSSRHAAYRTTGAACSALANSNRAITVHNHQTPRFDRVGRGGPGHTAAQPVGLPLRRQRRMGRVQRR